MGAVPLIGIAALLVLAVLAPAAWAHSGDLPDLVADPVSGPKFEVDASEAAPDRLLLRFHSWVHNDGVGPLEIRRSPLGASQQVFRFASALGGDPADTFGLRPQDLKFEDTDGHDHWQDRKSVV